MIKVKNMTIKDYIVIMDANTDVYPAWGKLLPAQKKYLAKVNIKTGDAKSFFDDGKLVAVGGIRFTGLGEAWMLTNPNVRSERKFALLKETKKMFVKLRDLRNLWRVFATSQISENFLRHLGFREESTPHVWTRYK